MDEQRICELWFAIVQRCAEVFGQPLPKRRLELGSRNSGWGVVLNASESDEPTLPQYSVAVSWGGFPAGVIDPNGGVIAAGSVANERTFREWLPSAVPCSA